MRRPNLPRAAGRIWWRPIEVEIKVLEKYLPKGLDAAKVDALIVAAIAETGATSKLVQAKLP